MTRPPSDVRPPAGPGGSSWEHFPHGADVGVRGRGATRAAAFAQAALALAAVTTDPARVRPHGSIEITCEAPDDDLLLLDWLNALIYEAATRHWVFGAFEVGITGGRLRARAFGEPIDLARHEPAVEVKGATPTGLRVAREADGRWVAECIVDV
ncbi:MAG: archease [Acidobacteriota bacterium]|nr:archease [Acidobacteriota bacterium]